MSEEFKDHTPGPRAIVTARNSCKGCPALELKEWKDYLENDGTDSGTSAHCAAANKSITAYWTERYSVPEFCKFVVVEPPSAPELLAENERLKAENEHLRARVADLIGAITSLNHAKHHEVIIGDDVGYYQRKEWVEWILDLAAHP